MLNRMSVGQIPDFQVVECFDSIVGNSIAKERQISRKTGKLIESLSKIFELVRIIFKIELWQWFHVCSIGNHNCVHCISIDDTLYLCFTNGSILSILATNVSLQQLPKCHVDIFAHIFCTGFGKTRFACKNQWSERN